MKPLTRRLQRLENWMSQQRNEEGETPADVLRKRIRAYAELEGIPFQEHAAQPSPDIGGKVLSVVEILRGHGHMARK